MGGGKYMMHRRIDENQPTQDDYIAAAKKLLGLKDGEWMKYCYMSTPVCFVRENLQEMLRMIAKRNFLAVGNLLSATPIAFPNITYMVTLAISYFIKGIMKWAKVIVA